MERIAEKVVREGEMEKDESRKRWKRWIWKKRSVNLQQWCCAADNGQSEKTQSSRKAIGGFRGDRNGRPQEQVWSGKRVSGLVTLPPVTLVDLI